MLEQKAHQLAVEAEQDKPKPKDKILFVRCVSSTNQSTSPAQWLIQTILPSFYCAIYITWHLFDLYRSDTSRSELAQLAKQANPDEIDIDEDEDAEDGEPDG